MIELVVWDYNGTLTNDLPRVAKAVNSFLREFGIPPATAEEVACPDGDIWRFYSERGIDLPKAEIGARVFGIYAHLPDPIPLNPGAVETLERIRQPQVLVTKHPAVLMEREIDELGIRRYFSQMFGGVRDKTALFQQICQERKIPPVQAVVIGDRCEDIEEGRRAGNRVIAIPGYHPRTLLERHDPDYLASSLPDAGEWIQRDSVGNENRA